MYVCDRLAWASYVGLNVSSTHSIIGGIIGFAWASKGPKGVLWIVKDPSSFPPYKGIIPIVLSWVFAPLLTGLSAAFIFWVVRTFVLRHPDSRQRVFWVLPFLVFVTSFVNIFFIFTKGAKKTLQRVDPEWNDTTAEWVSAVVALCVSLVTVMFMPLIKKSIFNEAAKRAAVEQMEKAKNRTGRYIIDRHRSESKVGREKSRKATASNWRKQAYNMATAGMRTDIHEYVETDQVVKDIHSRCEEFDPITEGVLAYLQVFSAICVMFAHGAAEVGYLAGGCEVGMSISHELDYMIEEVHFMLE